MTEILAMLYNGHQPYCVCISETYFYCGKFIILVAAAFFFERTFKLSVLTSIFCYLCLLDYKNYDHVYFYQQNTYALYSCCPPTYHIVHFKHKWGHDTLKIYIDWITAGLLYPKDKKIPLIFSENENFLKTGSNSCRAVKES